MPGQNRYSPTGVQKSFFAPSGTFADYTAPTALEMGSAVEIGHSMPMALFVPRSARSVDVSDPYDKQDKQQAGTRGGESWTFNTYREKDAGADAAAYDQLPEDTQGFIVIFRAGLAGASPAVGDVADVVPIVVGSVADVDGGRDEADRAAVTCFITDSIARDVALA